MKGFSAMNILELTRGCKSANKNPPSNFYRRLVERGFATASLDADVEKRGLAERGLS